jgi:gallate decarboxylase subunit D
VGRSATTSMLNCLGHKDDVLAKLFAEKIAIKSNHTTVCICGIHVDNISKEKLQLLYDGCLNLLEEILSGIS